MKGLLPKDFVEHSRPEAIEILLNAIRNKKLCAQHDERNVYYNSSTKHVCAVGALFNWEDNEKYWMDEYSSLPQVELRPSAINIYSIKSIMNHLRITELHGFTQSELIMFQRMHDNHDIDELERYLLSVQQDCETLIPAS